MEYVLLKKALSICETVFEGSSEQPVDVDFTLPDYCPDIEKILKCTAVPSIFSKNLSGGNLEIDGAVNIKVLYLDAKNKTIRCCEHSSPFSERRDICFTKNRIHKLPCADSAKT